jgi:hypothetical protein
MRKAEKQKTYAVNWRYARLNCVTKKANSEEWTSLMLGSSKSLKKRIPG